MLVYTEKFPQVLTWAPDEGLSADLKKRFEILLSESLGKQLASISRKVARESQVLIESILDLPDDPLQRLLTAPETCSRLIWPKRHSPDGIRQFLEDSILAEWARGGRTASLPRVISTALGDSVFFPDGSSWSAELIADIPMDHRSPHSHDLSGIANREQIKIEEFAEPEIDTLSTRLRSTMHSITASSAATAAFVKIFTSVVVAHKASLPSARFVSRSPQRRIGLTVLQNAHLDSVDEVDLAEGFIHESMHSLLDMDETIRQRCGAPWIKDDNLYDGTSRIVSPWTGNDLDLPTFVHACFIWFGLLHFWSRAHLVAAFTPRRIREQLIRAACGFLGNPLVDQLRVYKSDVAADLVETVHFMQAEVRAHFDGILMLNRRKGTADAHRDDA